MIIVALMLAMSANQCFSRLNVATDRAAYEAILREQGVSRSLAHQMAKAIDHGRLSTADACHYSERVGRPHLSKFSGVI